VDHEPSTSPSSGAGEAPTEQMLPTPPPPLRPSDGHRGPAPQPSTEGDPRSPFAPPRPPQAPQASTTANPPPWSAVTAPNASSPVGAPPRSASSPSLTPPPPLPPLERRAAPPIGGIGLPPSPPFQTRPLEGQPPGGALPPLPGQQRPGGPEPRRPTFGWVVAAAILSAVLASVLTVGAVSVLDDDDEPTTSAGTNQLVGERLDIQSLLTKAQPSVVAVQTGDAATSSLYGGAGTGVVIGEEGFVLTNWHVIGGANVVRVTLHDGSEHEADLIGSFPDDDIALVQIRNEVTLTAAELGSSAAAQVGDDVVAIGNALNLGGPPSVTEGIISATDRIIQTPEITMEGLIQTDAAINPGNSGGPLLNAQGQVIGINTAIISDAQNIGFAIPIDPIKPLIEELKLGRGTITPDSAFLGVITESVSDVPQAELDQFGVTASNGAFISSIQPGSAAERGGLEDGDVITAIDGQRVTSNADVGEIIRSRRKGDEVTIDYERDGRKESVTVELGTRSDIDD
jgi:S1-C subfamily serine protease